MTITLTTPELENLAKGYEFPKTTKEHLIAKGIAAEIAERRGQRIVEDENLYEEIDDLKRELQAERNELHDAKCSVAGKQMSIDELQKINRELLDVLIAWGNASWFAGYSPKEGSYDPVEHLLARTHKVIGKAEKELATWRD